MDEKHTLTSWGKVLGGILSSLDPADGHEEAAVLAVELLRLGLLNADTMFPNYTGGPSGGSGMYIWLGQDWPPAWIWLTVVRRRGQT